MRYFRWLLIDCMGLCSIFGKVHELSGVRLGGEEWCLVFLNAMDLVISDLHQLKTSSRQHLFRSLLVINRFGLYPPCTV
jgi:hypothetical protein